MVNNAKLITRSVGLGAAIALTTAAYDRGVRDKMEEYGLPSSSRERIDVAVKANSFSGVASLVAGIFYPSDVARKIRIGGFFGGSLAANMLIDRQNDTPLVRSTAINAAAIGMGAVALALTRKNIPLFQKEVLALLQKSQIDITSTAVGKAYTSVMKSAPGIARVLNKDNVALAVATGVMPYSHAFTSKVMKKATHHTNPPGNTGDVNTSTQRVPMSGTYGLDEAKRGTTLRMRTQTL